MSLAASLLLSLCAGLQEGTQAGAPPAPAADPIEIRLGDAPFTSLRFRALSRPVLWPVLDRQGRAVTRAWPLQDAPEDARDHVHQKSLWFAHGDVGGVDFWTEGKDSGRIEVDATERLAAEPDRVQLRMRCKWLRRDGSLVCTDVRDLTFAGAGDVRTIDYAVTLQASQGALTLGDTKEGTMAARVARGLCFDREGATGRALSSTGRRDGEVWGKRARWVAFSGEVDGAVVGIAMLDHPDNLRHPTTWHARPYGLLAANPFGLHEFEQAEKGSGAVELAADASLTLRYRIVVFAGAADRDLLDAQWQAFAAPARAPDAGR